MPAWSQTPAYRAHVRGLVSVVDFPLKGGEVPARFEDGPKSAVFHIPLHNTNVLGKVDHQLNVRDLIAIVESPIAPSCRSECVERGTYRTIANRMNMHRESGSICSAYNSVEVLLGKISRSAIIGRVTVRVEIGREQRAELAVARPALLAEDGLDLHPEARLRREDRHHGRIFLPARALATGLA